ncbi:hypothetical protein [Bacillus safensis]|uniref:Uncharacterized protein n=1 Tax=Bacillus safensis TaxID=561879 RepID=A0AC61YPX6_BACIA|nr:hypothetical protein [Bacillus safensis]MCY7675988.1 hypothetical protein [Bacillus safensis]MCY7699986.1 hypothetical protein [Bacillus safensis]MEC3629083.1 hypothetical protein [Bacillus safensis]
MTLEREKSIKFGKQPQSNINWRINERLTAMLMESGAVVIKNVAAKCMAVKSYRIS